MKKCTITLCLLAAICLPSPSFAASTEVTKEKVEDSLCRAVDSGDVDKAVELARRLCDLEEKSGCDANGLARRLSDLSKLILASGDYTGAREPLDKALKQLDSNPSAADQKVLVNTLVQLGELVSFQGDYQSALPLLHRAVALSEKMTDPQADRLRATALVRLAQTHDNSGHSDKSYALYATALSLLEKEQDADKQDLIDCLNSLATQLQSRKKYTEASAYVQRALKLSEELHGLKHSDTAVLLNNLAMLERDQGRFDLALPKLKQALGILRETVGPQHLSVGRVHESLADVYYLKGDLPAAQSEVLEAAGIVNKHIFDVLPALSLAEQESFLASTVPLELSLSLSTCRKGKELESAYGIIMNWKGLLIDSLRRHKSMMNVQGDADCEKLIGQLDKLRTEIAGWYGQAGTVPLEDWKKTNDALTQQKEEVERSLSARLRKLGRLEPLMLDCRKLAACLRPDETLVDIFEYAPFGRGDDKHYGAVILNAGDLPRFVDLGAVRDLALVVARWRGEVLASRAAVAQWTDLQSALWLPIQKELNPASKKLFVCPDGELARVPWHLLSSPTGKSANSGILMTEVDSARELFELRNSAPSAADESLLIAGGIDFNSNPYGKDSQAALVRLPALPGTLTEINTIKTIAAREHFKVNELTGDKATKQAILAMLPKSEYVHLATHGFFFDENYVQAVQQLAQEKANKKLEPQSKPVLSTRSVTVLPSAVRRSNMSQQRNPLVESGIAVAGANLRDPGTRENLGYVTAEELVGMDMEKCRMMTLSACETGRGEEITGQGVMGLRAAIMSAGVKSILMSVWKVPDDATVRLMEEFYSNLWLKKMTKAEALRQAQLALRNDASKPHFRNPVSWSAWVLVGEGW